MVDRRSDSLQLSRQWALLKVLSTTQRAFGVKELADQLQVSKATIERDLATLREFGVVEEAAGKQKKVFRINGALESLPDLGFGVAELLAIYAALASTGPLSGTPIHADLEAAMHKIRGRLAGQYNGLLDAMFRVFARHVRGGVDYGGQGEELEELCNAIAKRRICEIEYRAASTGEIRTHRLRPLRIVSHASALYLLACVRDRADITTFAIHRIRTVTCTQEQFEAPRVDVDAHIYKAFGIFVSDAEEDVEIHFAADTAYRIEERTFHPDERKERMPDGRLRYTIRTSAQWEIVPWVQSFGPLAELIRPQAWRDVIRANAQAVLARYSS